MKRKQLVISLVLLGIFLGSIFVTNVNAYGLASTHQSLGYTSRKILERDGYALIADEFRIYSADLNQGLEDADHGDYYIEHNGERFPCGGVSFTAYRFHYHHWLFHHGYDGVAVRSAADFAQVAFNLAVDTYATDKADAYKYFGIALHLLQDQTIPHHARCAYVFTNHKHYEAWIDNNWKEGAKIAPSYLSLTGKYGFSSSDGHYTEYSAWGWVDYAAHIGASYYYDVNQKTDDYAPTAEYLADFAARIGAGFMKLFWYRCHETFANPQSFSYTTSKVCPDGSDKHSLKAKTADEGSASKTYDGVQYSNNLKDGSIKGYFYAEASQYQVGALWLRTGSLSSSTDPSFSSGYMARLYNDRLWIRKYINGQWYSLGEQNLGVLWHNKWWYLEFEVSGSTLTAKAITGSISKTLTVTDYSISNGKPGFSARTNLQSPRYLYIDEITIEEYGSSCPSSKSPPVKTVVVKNGAANPSISSLFKVVNTGWNSYYPYPKYLVTFKD